MTIEERAKAKYPTAYDIDTPSDVRAEKDAYIAGATEQLNINIKNAVGWLCGTCAPKGKYTCAICNMKHNLLKAMGGDDILSQRIVDYVSSVRCIKCLKAAGIETLGDLVQYKRSDLLKFRNFGRKSLSELDDLLYINGLEWKE